MYNETALKNVLSEISRKSQEIFGDTLESIFLFGSYARGDHDKESDIDVMVLVDTPAENLGFYRKSIIELSTDLDLQYGVFTSIKLQDFSTFEEWKDTLPFYRKILEEGICIND